MTTLLTAERVRVEFGSLVAVRDVSVDLSGGELMGLVGPNGAGKTTLLRVLCGLHAPTRGRATIMGKPVLGEHEVVRHHVGFAPDTPPAYETLTIYRFLRFIAGAYGMDRGEADERIDFWLEQLWLVDKRDVLIKNLSRGMRQRVTLARTFIPRPHVLLLDEPLAGLDPAGRLQLRRVLSMLREQGCAMIVSSHILTDLEEIATHVAIIERGRILRCCRIHELHDHADEQRTFRLVTLDDANDYQERVASLNGITAVRRDGFRYTFQLGGGEPEAAEVLKQFVTGGIPVVAFSEVKASLEEAYLRAGVRQVD